MWPSTCTGVRVCTARPRTVPRSEPDPSYRSVRASSGPSVRANKAVILRHGVLDCPCRAQARGPTLRPRDRPVPGWSQEVQTHLRRRRDPVRRHPRVATAQPSRRLACLCASDRENWHVSRKSAALRRVHPDKPVRPEPLGSDRPRTLGRRTHVDPRGRPGTTLLMVGEDRSSICRLRTRVPHSGPSRDDLRHAYRLAGHARGSRGAVGQSHGVGATPLRPKIMGPRWDRTARHLTAAPDPGSREWSP